MIQVDQSISVYPKKYQKIGYQKISKGQNIKFRKSGLGVFNGYRRACYLMTCHVSIGVSAMPWPLCHIPLNPLIATLSSGAIAAMSLSIGGLNCRPKEV